MERNLCCLGRFCGSPTPEAGTTVSWQPSESCGPSEFLDCRDLVERIIDVIPYDPTDLEDVIHAQLLTGEIAKSLASAEKLDVWLSCHLADVMNALGLLQEVEEGEDAIEE